jgi:hypothetical protein
MLGSAGNSFNVPLFYRAFNANFVFRGVISDFETVRTTVSPLTAALGECVLVGLCFSACSSRVLCESSLVTLSRAGVKYNGDIQPAFFSFGAAAGLAPRVMALPFYPQVRRCRRVCVCVCVWCFGLLHCLITLSRLLSLLTQGQSANVVRDNSSFLARTTDIQWGTTVFSRNTTGGFCWCLL